MVEEETTEVLVVGAGPVGLTAALELRRRGVEVLLVDRLLEPLRYAKAVGIQPRTLEIWDAMGIVRPALDACTRLRGQLLYKNGALVNRLDMSLPDEVPYRFVALPQYETERILAAALAEHGAAVTRGLEFLSLEQDATSVRSTLRDGTGQLRYVTSRYLIGCDGAHSAVRTGLGVDFTGDAFAEGFMLADVEVDWDLPTGYAIRATHEQDGVVDDVLVCIPLPGHNRYRISMFVAPELIDPQSTAQRPAEHGLQGGRAPELKHVQQVLDRLAPQPTTASTMRWSSLFRISHRLADRYSVGRVFLAGDAAHIHPPTGAQGMNTGIQDAVNLAWKLALAVQGRAADGLLDSYHTERYPVGAEVVGRTVTHARAGFGTDGGTLQDLMLREAQLLVGYPDSPVVGAQSADRLTGGPIPGQRAPDVTGLSQDTVSGPIRFAELLRHPGFTLAIWAGDSDAADKARPCDLSDVPDLRCYVIVDSQVSMPDVSGTVFRDADGRFAAAYGTAGVGTAAYLVRPDGYIGFRTCDISAEAIRHAVLHVGIRRERNS